MKPITPAAIGKRLNALLNRQKINQAELARQAGTSRATLNHYLHGRKLPTLPVLQRLAEELGTNISDLLAGFWPPHTSGDPTTPPPLTPQGRPPLPTPPRPGLSFWNLSK